MPTATKNLPRDASRAPLPVGGGFVLEDASTHVSPLSYTTGEIELVIPSNAAEIVMRATSAIRIKDETAGASYYLLPADVTQVFPVADKDSIFFIRDSASGTLNFYFVMIGM